MRSAYVQKAISKFVAGFALYIIASTCSPQTVTPPQSTFFSTVAEESYSTYQISGNGDLWPSCWADDGNLYAANGDGTNFSTSFYSMAVGKINGTPTNLNLTGSFVAGDVGYNYSGSPYTDKPTGMLCVGGAIYLAYQNLNETTFEDAPAASIVESTDHGATWSANPSTPMFGTPGNTSNPASYMFTTIFFLDFGQNYANAIDNYVYAYGLDNNWRDQTAVYLARAPNTSVLNRSTWQFFTGMSGSVPTWSSDITQKVGVLTDQRELYQTVIGTDCPADQKIIAQGGAVYDAPLQRYIMVTWGCATHEFYEAPQPWGPWSHFYSKDFGPLRLVQNRGQYGTSIPSKFISPDGLTLYLQSNVCCSGDSYTFSLRKLYLQPYASSSPANTYSTTNLALAAGAQAVSKSTHYGTLCSVNCADQISSAVQGASEDDFDEENKPADNVESFWGYTWPQAYNINQVVYTTGTMYSTGVSFGSVSNVSGGWFTSGLSVQVRQNFEWTDVSGVTITPGYPYSSQTGGQTTYTFSFPDTWGDGVRIIGVPGGTGYFTSINNLQVYYTQATTTEPAGFQLQIAPTTLSVSQGNSGTVTLTITPKNGFSQQVSFACSGLPSESACGFSPETVTPSGTASSSVTVTIATTAASARRDNGPWPFTGAQYAVALCLLTLCKRMRFSFNARRMLFVVVLALAACGVVTSCGGGNSGTSPTNPGTPEGTSTVTITATGGSGSSEVTQTAQFSLTVQ